MLDYFKCSKEELNKELNSLMEEYNNYKSLNLKLNMARGMPSEEQLKLSLPMLDILNSSSDLTSTSIDCRTYGTLFGLPECRKLFADLLDVDEDNVLIYGTSSLNIMFDLMSMAYQKGINGSIPWNKLDNVKFLCPVPGYDRHFDICEYFGIKMINVPLNSDGPDMDIVEELVSKDKDIKGIWCVPKYSNPEGISYSNEVITRLAKLRPLAEDFRIYYDNAYGIHDVYDEHDEILNIYRECQKYHNEDILYEFLSTSKMTFPGSGVASLTTSKHNIEQISITMFTQTICFDKMNQLRHVRFLKDKENTLNHMKKHANIIRPKFDLVLKMLDENLSSSNLAHWTKPKGGYFISLYVLKGCAKEVVKTCKDLGVILTPAGSTYPYKNDPDDSNIRIAPTYPVLEDLEKSIRVLIFSIKLASIKKILEAK